MADTPTIQENGDLLKKIVAEKGFSGYKHRYYWILQEVIGKDTIYEELSEENKAILHHETGLDGEKIKVMSELVYGKPEPTDDDADAEVNPVQTKIGFVLSLLPYRKSITYNPLPEEKRLNPLDEYIAFMGISLQMLRIQDDPVRGRNLFLYLRYAIKDYVQSAYSDAKYDGILRLFNGNVSIDLTLYNIAIRMDKTRELRVRENVSPFMAGHFFLINEYNLYRGPGYSCKTMDEFCERCNYIDFPSSQIDIKSNIKDFFASDKVYAELHSLLTNKVWGEINTEEQNQYKDRVLQLITELNEEKISNSGDIGKSKEILSMRLEELREEIETILNSKPKEYSFKQRLYLLKRFADDALKSRFSTPRDKIYAILLGASEDSVRAVSNQIKKDNLDYKNYNEQAYTIIEMYNLVEALGYDGSSILSQMEEDLIPKANTEKQSLKKLEEHTFVDKKLRQRVINKIISYHEDKAKNDTK